MLGQGVPACSVTLRNIRHNAQARTRLCPESFVCMLSGEVSFSMLPLEDSIWRDGSGRSRGALPLSKSAGSAPPSVDMSATGQASIALQPLVSAAGSWAAFLATALGDPPRRDSSRGTAKPLLEEALLDLLQCCAFEFIASHCGACHGRAISCTLEMLAACIALCRCTMAAPQRYQRRCTPDGLVLAGRLRLRWQGSLPAFGPHCARLLLQLRLGLLPHAQLLVEHGLHEARPRQHALPLRRRQRALPVDAAGCGRNGHPAQQCPLLHTLLATCLTLRHLWLQECCFLLPYSVVCPNG